MPVTGRLGVLRAALIVAGLLFVTTACGGGTASTQGGGEKIALLLPESKTTRYESQDRPSFERKVKELCQNCQILYSNADQDASKQQQQAEAAITNGARVLVLDPVDSASAAGIVKRAKQSNIPVISYDRLVLNADVDYYVSFDNERVGQLQAQGLVDKLKEQGKSSGNIVMINGSPTDNNAKLFKKGAHSVFDTSSFKIGKEYDTPDWSPDKAQQEMDQAITSLGKDGFAGVYAANDGTAGGAIAAMKAAGIDPVTRPVVGQDAELAAIQRLLTGEQYMTVYKAIKPEAESAAELGVALAKGQAPPSGLINGKIENGAKSVPSVLLKPVPVTKANIKDTVVKDGFWTVQQICTPEFAQACKEAGL